MAFLVRWLKKYLLRPKTQRRWKRSRRPCFLPSCLLFSIRRFSTYAYLAWTISLYFYLQITAIFLDLKSTHSAAWHRFVSIRGTPISLRMRFSTTTGLVVCLVMFAVETLDYDHGRRTVGFSYSAHNVMSLVAANISESDLTTSCPCLVSPTIRKLLAWVLKSPRKSPCVFPQSTRKPFYLSTIQRWRTKQWE